MPVKTGLVVSMTLIYAALSFAALADAVELKEIVVTGTRTEKPILETPVRTSWSRAATLKRPTPAILNRHSRMCPACC